MKETGNSKFEQAAERVSMLFMEKYKNSLNNIGFKYHLIIDGVDYAYSTSCSKDNFTEYLKLIIFSMVATAHYNGLITEKEFQELRP